MRLNRSGRNRWVVLVGRWAVKFPSFRSWRDFLFGLINNMNEAAWSAHPGACPVVASIPGGFAVVMPRCAPVTWADLEALDHAQFAGLRVEHKPDSFGLLAGRIVAVDYGW